MLQNLIEKCPHMKTRPELFDRLEKVSYLNFLQGVMTDIFVMRDYAGKSLKGMFLFQNSSFIGS